ncbi:MAG: hypothetical protein IJC77_02305 [Bacteroidaceae bacterium]|nr:hypothetical protein [Bacteroidaceae bacterium]
MDYIGEKELNNKLNDFKNHLENADRMILSAKFGEGKSFFLQQVREDIERFSEYEFITIYPVNYVVAPNEDIFEYIKRDILIQLAKLDLLSGIDLERLITSIFSFENFKEVISFLFSCIPGGNICSKLLDKATEISQKYEEQKKTYEKYFKTFEVQKGGLYEDDAYTQMIKEALNLLKNGYNEGGKDNPPKKPVLIIEDLDRLDPAHLFRILNVISAHIDDCSKPDKVGNKFGFSNIVIVMDYDTTQHIFEHFYGKEASYAGYMSKFLSEEPFRYSITELALPKLKEKIKQEVGINKDFFDVFRIMNLKLAKLSMRDIVRLYDLNASSRIYQESIRVREESLSTQLPIFKLLIYMTELGMSCGDIDKDLELKTRRCVEYLKLLFPLHFASKDGGAICYDVGDNGYEIVLDKEDGVVNRIRIQNTIMSGAPINVIRDLKCSMYSQSLSEYIDFSGLNRSDKYTIPGYNPPITAD